MREEQTETAPQAEEPPIVILCGGKSADPGDPYADVMAGVMFRWSDGSLV